MNFDWIVDELVKIREEKGMTRTDVTRALDVRWGTLVGWETKQFAPSNANLTRWAAALGYELVMDLVLKNSETGKGD